MPTATGERSATETALALTPTLATSTEIVESDNPNVETEAYQRSIPRWNLCRALMVGVEAIRAGGTLYLPQHPNESNTRYEVRRVIAGLFNGFQRTVLACEGMLTLEPVKLSKDMPAELVKMWENATGDGMHGDVLTARLAKAGMTDGLAGLVTEYPRANDPRIDRSKASLAATIALATGAELDAADVEALGLRPYFILVKADAVLNPVYQTVNGRKTLVQITFRENATEKLGRFKHRQIRRYRVYELNNRVVTYELWVEKDGKTEREEGPTVMRNLTSIPWAPFVAGDEIAPGEYRPPLLDLAFLNITHHQINTNILSLESLACTPTPVRVGAEPDDNDEYPPLVLGPSSTIEVPATVGVSTPFYWSSPDIAVLEPAMKSLETCKQEMGAMGAQFLSPEPRAQETAAAHRMDQAAERATIATVSRALQDCLETAFDYAGQYVRKPAGEVAVNTEFSGEGIDPAFRRDMISAYVEGALTLEELRYVLQTGKLPEGFEPTETLDLLAAAAEKEAQRAEREAAAKAARDDAA